MSSHARPRKGWVAFGLTVLAVAYSAVLLFWVVAIPEFGRGEETLLEYGGPLTLVIFVQPLIFSALIWALLRRSCSVSESKACGVATWGSALYLVWSVLGGFTVAAGAMPAAMLLLAAALFTPRGSPASA